MKQQKNYLERRKTLFAVLFAALFIFPPSLSAERADNKTKAERSLRAYFASYTAKDATFAHQPRLDSLKVDRVKETVEVVADGSFAQQPFTDKQVRKIYKQVKKALPKPFNKYDLKIKANGMYIEYLVPDSKLPANEGHAYWGSIDYDGHPWTLNTSRPVSFTHGLEGRHLSLWASHGRYYNNKVGRWLWQRPQLFCTTEDLFTQTIVVPYLIPMLEKAGAVVFTPRERDWQLAEYVVDPDGGLNSNTADYAEYTEREDWETTGKPGFAAHAGTYQDGENPFAAGRARQIKTTKKDGQAFAKWQPRFGKTDKYAVYVSYQTTDNSVDDAHYTVFHQGTATEFSVNQQMGGGTWVYLGTFTFDKGSSVDNCVMLTNQSRSKGVVTADAVRFGGGMGNVERGGSVSGYPRAIEGARYYAQWAGAPTNVYDGRKGTDDYSDDINVRSLMANWLSGGSVYNPTQDGEKVPFELSLAVHSDAGYAPDGKSLVGSLAVCTTDFNDGRLAAGITRQSSKLFANALIDNAEADLTRKYGYWKKRWVWDRNYSETRLPAQPSAIMETLSHQNFPDMLMAQDPNFRFDFARSIYKTIARFVNGMHGKPTIIEPLTPQNVAVTLNSGEATLSWNAQKDPLESTANPTSFIVYTAIGKGSFDNGTKVSGSPFSMPLDPDVPYRFKVSASNRGGESFPSEVVSVVYHPHATQTVLVVNGFHRLSSPAVINDGTSQGFDLNEDIGVTYGTTAGWSGRQQSFNMQNMGSETETGLGYSGNELAGHFIAGNTFDYISVHAEAIASANLYNVVSCSSEAVETGKVKLGGYAAVDLILGLEKNTPTALKYYKTFSSTMQQKLTAYTRQGGRLLVSGAYIGSDMTAQEDAIWLRRTLTCHGQGRVSADSITGVSGMGIDHFDFCRQLNPDHYAVQHADRLQPDQNAFCAMQYSDGSPAAVAYDGNLFKSFAMGFPFESITDATVRANIMRGILSFLLK